MNLNGKIRKLIQYECNHRKEQEFPRKKAEEVEKDRKYLEIKGQKGRITRLKSVGIRHMHRPLSVRKASFDPRPKMVDSPLRECTVYNYTTGRISQ